MYLNQKGYLQRGKDFRMQKIHTLLSDTLYCGEYHFNVIDSKTGQKRPPEEWIITTIPVIVDANTFEQVRLKRHARAPKQTPAARLTSPTLLTGLLRCGICGHQMTLATGKGGRYKYYKCTNRLAKGNAVCSSKNLPMEKTDALVLRELADKVFEAKRLQKMLTAFRKSLSQASDDKLEQANQINRQIKQLEERQHRLMDAIEAGVLELDQMTQTRAQDLKRAKEALLIELANVSRNPTVELQELRASQVEKLSNMLKRKLLDDCHEVAKGYLNLLVSEIVVHPDTVTMKGAYADLLALTEDAKMKKGAVNTVPSSILDWRARQESNL